MKIRILILLVAVAVFAIPSYAQFQDLRPIEVDEGGGWSGETSYSNGEYLDNPCTAVQDWVWVDYSAYVQGEQEAAGVDRYFFNESTTMGGMYAASGASKADIGYGASFATRKYHKVNTPDNFHVVTVINFDPAYQYTWVTMETACGNGMPDSAQ
jgi:hypothetical protein